MSHYTKLLTKLSSITNKHVKLDVEICSQTDTPLQTTNYELLKQYAFPEDVPGHGHRGHENNSNKIRHV